MGAAFVLVSLFLLLAGICVPGWALVRRFLRPEGVVEEAVYSLAVGIAVVPSLTFAVAWSLGLPFSTLLVLSVAAVLVLGCRPWSLPAGAKGVPGKRETSALLVLVALALGMYLLTDFHSVRSFRFLECCLHSVASYLSIGDDPSWSLYDPWSGSDITYAIARPSGPVFDLGLWDREQRLFNGAVIATFMKLTGRAAIEVAGLVVFFLLLGSSTLIAGRYLRGWPARIAVGLATTVGLHGLIGYMVNESSLALVMASSLLALLLRPRVSRGGMVLAGVLLGGAIASRYSAWALLLPVGWAVSRIAQREGIPARRALLLGLAVVMGPWLLAYGVLEGNPLFHSHAALEIPHTLFGIDFQFRPLNWPFHDALVRPPDDLVPPLFYVPLKFVQSLGSLLVAAALLGFVSVVRDRGARGDLILVVTWALPLTAFMMVLADIDHEKLSWLLVAAPVLPLLLARFLERAWIPSSRWAFVIGATVLSVPLAFLPVTLLSVEIPVDGRELPFYIPDGDNFNPDSIAPETREALGRFALLPSMHSVATEGRLWRALSHPKGEAPSGRVFARLDGHETTRLSFTVEASTTPPALPEPVLLEPNALLHFVNMYIVVYLRIESADTIEVHVEGRPEGLRLDIDPGPLPHTDHYVMFMLDEQMSDMLPVGDLHLVRAFVGGRALDTRGLGYLVHQDGASSPRVSLVTNLRLPEQPYERRAFPCGKSRCEAEWGLIGADGRVLRKQNPAAPREAAKGGSVNTGTVVDAGLEGEAVLDIVGPVCW